MLELDISQMATGELRTLCRLALRSLHAPCLATSYPHGAYSVVPTDGCRSTMINVTTNKPTLITHTLLAMQVAHSDSIETVDMPIQQSRSPALPVGCMPGRDQYLSC